MKTIYKHFYLTLCAALAFAMGACTDEVGYTPATSPEGAQVYFPNTLASKIDLDINATSFNVQIGRAATDVTTVNLTVTDESGLFTIPSSVSFAAGEKMANLTIIYDPATLEFDDYKEITIAVADESNKTVYGESSYSFKAGIPSPWTSLGMCTFSDLFLFGNSYQVELQQNDLDKNLYRLVRPYREGLSAEGYGGVTGSEQEYPEFRVLQPGDVWKEVNVTMSDLVAFADISTEWENSSYGETVYLLHPSRFTSMADENYWTYSRVASYQENGLPAVIELAPYYYMFNVGGWNYTTSPMVTIVFPGVVLLDASVEVAYTGLFTSVDEEVFAVADVTLGEDVEKAMVTLVPSSQVDAAVAGIIDGSIEAIEMTASGEVKVPVPADAEEGKHAVVAVTFVGDEAQESASATFKYTPANAETWTQVGVGTYTYTAFFEGDDPNLSLFRSDSNPNRYKVEHWGYDVDFKFTYNAETGEVVVDDQETGYVHPSYGMVNVIDVSTYYETNEMPGYYENGVFYFAVAYYVSDGSFGYNYETFTLTDAAAAAYSSRAVAGKSVKNGLQLERARIWEKTMPEYCPLSK